MRICARGTQTSSLPTPLPSARHTRIICDFRSGARMVSVAPYMVVSTAFLKRARSHCPRAKYAAVRRSRACSPPSKPNRLYVLTHADFEEHVRYRGEGAGD